MRSMQLKTFSAALMVLAVSTASASTIDTTTHGNWIGVYGGQGYILNDYGRVAANSGSNNVYDGTALTSNDVASLPSYISSYSYGTGTQQFVWESNNSSDQRFPEDPRAATPATAPRIAATSFNGGDFSVNLSVAQAAKFDLGVYLLDYEGAGREVNVTVNGETVRVPPLSNTDAYHQGEWVVFHEVAGVGTLPINIHFLANANATISEIAFSAYTPEPSSFVLGGLGVVGLVVAARRRKA